ncbi:MAG: helix-turn-helix domain-containing protein [Armatimonadota bacterium]
MNKRTRGSYPRPDWMLRATWHDYQLTPDLPVYPLVSAHPRPTPLQIDLHEGIEVGVVLSGKQERHYPDWTVNLSAGDVWLQPMWEPHGWRITALDTKSLLLIFLPQFLAEEKIGEYPWLSLFAAPVHLRPWVRDGEVRSRALLIGEEIAEEITRRERGWLAAVRLGMLRLLFVLSRQWTPPAESPDPSRANTGNLSRVMPAVALIQQRRPGSVTVGEAAAACRLSRSRFNSIFRQTMGTSFGQFSLRARLGFAAHRLLTTDLTVEVIAQRAGFVDASHFHRTFVRHYGRTPAQYRVRPA